MDSKYNYTTEEYKEAFNRVIDNYIESKAISEYPKLVFAAGQPGSGKTGLIKNIKKDFKETQFITIDMDNYRMYHPKLKNISTDMVDFIEYTNDFSIQIEKDMLEYCLKNRMNFIHVGTMRVYEYLNKIVISYAKSQGYDIGLYALAVTNAERKISEKLKEEEQRKENEGKYVRVTSEKFIDEADKGFQNSVKIMSDSKDISNIKIFIRGKNSTENPILVYDDKEQKGKIFKNAYDALIKIRQNQEKCMIGEKNGFNRK